MTEAESTPPAEASPEQPDRRGLLAAIGSIVIGTFLIAVPLVAGLWTFFDPLIRRQRAGVEVPVGTLAQVPADGRVVQFEVVGETLDAWTRTVGSMGSVYVRRLTPEEIEAADQQADGEDEADGQDEGGDEVQLLVLHATCPHAGCFINNLGGHFQCPCHNSLFHLDGSRGVPCVSPRPMDRLDYRIDDAGTIHVTYKNFLAGKTEKIPI